MRNGPRRCANGRERTGKHPGRRLRRPPCFARSNTLGPQIWFVKTKTSLERNPLRGSAARAGRRIRCGAASRATWIVCDCGAVRENAGGDHPLLEKCVRGDGQIAVRGSMVVSVFFLSPKRTSVHLKVQMSRLSDASAIIIVFNGKETA